MSKTIEKTGKTAQEAIDLALKELNATKDEVNIEILEESNKKMFGLLGAKEARVRVTLKDSRMDRVGCFLEKVLGEMGVDASIDIYESDESVEVNLVGDKVGIVIGRRGETLDALQYLCSLVMNKGMEDYKRLTLDVENYRQKREATLINLAENMASKVVRYKKELLLEPMNPAERRIIHASLQEHKYVETISVGEEPYRKVVIRLK
jgi:spoIIIJ-associated protein